MKTRKWLGLVVAELVLSLCASGMAKPQKQTISFDGNSRIYYVYVPDKITTPAPLILLLHGSGRDGMSQIDAWKALAEEKKVILVAPNSFDSKEWSFAADGPEFFHSVVEAVKAAYPVDGRRMYLFGHSAGAIFALYLAIMESQYFAAAAIHAGALTGDSDLYMNHAQRKIPVAIWVGTKDQFFSLENVRKTRDKFKEHGFPVQLTEMPGHDHDYYSVAGTLNKSIWDFFNAAQLAGDPSWEAYRQK
ncbi:MAG TPA: alpha/beta hydrolase-fold protein [Candidatus Angelobacter sp.]